MDFIEMYHLRDLSVLTISIRIVLALIIGGLLGIERGRKNRPAGLRTYMLVCLGSTLVMLTNQYVYEYFHASDPTRMGAQVISGIGFLGTGAIILTSRNQVRGITTAAGMWTSACCGLAIGIGFYEGAILGAIAIFLIMTVLQRIDSLLHKYTQTLELYIEFDDKHTLGSFLAYVRQHKFDVIDMQLSKLKQSKDVSQFGIFTIESRRRRTHATMLSLINQAPGVHFIEKM